MNPDDRSLRDLSVVILDAQTTGSSPKLGSLLEIAYAVSSARPDPRPLDVQARWVALPPKTRVSRVVRDLTGYNDADAAQAISPMDAWRELVSCAREASPGPERAAPAVVHFAQFETPFLYDLHARFRSQDEPFPFDIICTHAIARRLYPDLPRSNIRALAGFLGHTTSTLRRAEGHVLATSHIWSTLVERLEAQGIHTWQELTQYLGSTRSRRSKRTFPMDKSVRAGLPNDPGVYRFKRSNGDILYVGKATNLKKRVANHFSAAKRAPARSQEMLTQALDVDFTVTATPLEAALLEVDQIKAIDPPYNVHLRARQAWFSNVDLDAAHHSVGTQHCLGPLPASAAVLGLGAVLVHRKNNDLSPLVIARAMQTPIQLAPSPEIFLEGMSVLTRRHGLSPGRGQRGRWMRLGLQLSLGQQEDSESNDDDPDAWDPARVMRHLERSIAQGARLLMRGRWLTILSFSRIEIEDATHRWLDVRGGVVEASSDRPAEEAPRAPAWRERQATFDGPRYDRLRVLNTEIRRIASEGRLVRIHIQRANGEVTLEGPRLLALLSRT